MKKIVIVALFLVFSPGCGDEPGAGSELSSDVEEWEIRFLGAVVPESPPWTVLGRKDRTVGDYWDAEQGLPDLYACVWVDDGASGACTPIIEDSLEATWNVSLGFDRPNSGTVELLLGDADPFGDSETRFLGDFELALESDMVTFSDVLVEAGRYTVIEDGVELEYEITRN